MNFEEIIGKTCLIGLSYYDTNGNLLKQTQHAGTVVNTDNEKGISIELTEALENNAQNQIATDKEGRVFVIPPLLSPWFNAPSGAFRDAKQNLLIENPDYLVTWEVHKTQDEKQGDHEWWEWVPLTTPPIVNNE